MFGKKLIGVYTQPGIVDVVCRANDVVDDLSGNRNAGSAGPVEVFEYLFDDTAQASGVAGFGVSSR